MKPALLSLLLALPLAAAQGSAHSERLWAGGRVAALAQDGKGGLVSSSLTGLRLDNHWVALG